MKSALLVAFGLFAGATGQHVPEWRAESSLRGASTSMTRATTVSCVPTHGVSANYKTIMVDNTDTDFSLIFQSVDESGKLEPCKTQSGDSAVNGQEVALVIDPSTTKWVEITHTKDLSGWEAEIWPNREGNWPTLYKIPSLLRVASPPQPLQQVSCVTQSNYNADHVTILVDNSQRLPLKFQTIDNSGKNIQCTTASGNPAWDPRVAVTIDGAATQWVEITQHDKHTGWEAEIWRTKTGAWPKSVSVSDSLTTPTPLTTPVPSLQCTFDGENSTTMHVNNTRNCLLKVRTCNTDVSKAPYPTCHGGPGTPTSYKDCPRFLPASEQVDINVDSDVTYVAFVCCPGGHACDDTDFEVYKDSYTGKWPDMVQIPQKF